MAAAEAGDEVGGDPPIALDSEPKGLVDGGDAPRGGASDTERAFDFVVSEPMELLVTPKGGAGCESCDDSALACLAAA